MKILASLASLASLALVLSPLACGSSTGGTTQFDSGAACHPVPIAQADIDRIRCWIAGGAP